MYSEEKMKKTITTDVAIMYLIVFFNGKENFPNFLEQIHRYVKRGTSKIIPKIAQNITKSNSLCIDGFNKNNVIAKMMMYEPLKINEIFGT